MSAETSIPFKIQNLSRRSLSEAGSTILNPQSILFPKSPISFPVLPMLFPLHCAPLDP
jgi:hypothetical protein